MMTIRGEHISVIRPVKVHLPQLPKETYRVHYNTRPKTRVLGAAEFFRICLLWGEGEVSMGDTIKDRDAWLDRMCKHCGCTFGAHSASSYYSDFYKRYIPLNCCPGTEGRMDWDKGPGMTFKEVTNETDDTSRD